MLLIQKCTLADEKQRKSRGRCPEMDWSTLRVTAWREHCSFVVFIFTRGKDKISKSWWYRCLLREELHCNLESILNPSLLFYMYVSLYYSNLVLGGLVLAWFAERCDSTSNALIFFVSYLLLLVWILASCWTWNCWLRCNGADIERMIFWSTKSRCIFNLFRVH